MPKPVVRKFAMILLLFAVALAATITGNLMLVKHAADHAPLVPFED